MNRARPTVTPLGAIGRGLLAGAMGTTLMTGWQMLSAKLRSSGEDAGGAQPNATQDPWERASAPAKVARRVSEGVFKQEVSTDLIPLLTNAMHWGYGTGWGAVYGLVAGSIGSSRLRGGLLFGSAVWAMSYVQLVPMGLYEPPWKYPPEDLALDLSYHLAYGAGVSAGYRFLDRS